MIGERGFKRVEHPNSDAGCPKKVSRFLLGLSTSGRLTNVSENPLVVTNDSILRGELLQIHMPSSFLQPFYRSL